MRRHSLIPWLAKCDQELVHPNAVFDTPDQQKAHIRDWLAGRVDFDPSFDIHFYPGRYAIDKGSIVPVGDVTQYVPEEEADVAVLEEPEHLTWFHHGTRWTDKFRHVVGIIHTNYLEYARREKDGDKKEAMLRGVNATVARIHCHKIIKLSDAVQDFSRSITVNVHGVSQHFISVGSRIAQLLPQVVKWVALSPRRILHWEGGVGQRLSRITGACQGVQRNGCVEGQARNGCLWKRRRLQRRERDCSARETATDIPWAR